MFDFVGTIDNANYLCIPAALKFRQEVCGGEEAIMNYSIQVAREGGDRAAQILSTEVLDNKEGTLRNCAMANVRLPLTVGSGAGEVKEKDVGLVTQWVMKKSADDYETFLATSLYQGAWWWRISGEAFLDVEDVVWGAEVMKKLCERVKKGEHVVVEGKP